MILESISALFSPGGKKSNKNGSLDNQANDRLSTDEPSSNMYRGNLDQSISRFRQSSSADATAACAEEEEDAPASDTRPRPRRSSCDVPAGYEAGAGAGAGLVAAKENGGGGGGVSNRLRLCIRVEVSMISRYRICDCDPQDDVSSVWSEALGTFQQVFFIRSGCKGKPLMSDRTVSIGIIDCVSS